MDFSPIRISTIKPLKDINFDLYIFYKEQFLKYIDTGKSLDGDHLKKLRKQKIARFFVTSIDEEHYQQYLDDILAESISSSDVSVAEKVNLTEGAATTAVERMQKDPNSKSAYNMTEKTASSLRQVVTQNPDALKEIFGKKAEEDDMLIKHCLNVCALSAKLAEKCGLEEKDQDYLAVAGLLHDIGVTKLPAEKRLLFKVDPSQMPNEDLILYRSHTQLSFDLLQDKEYVNKKIASLILHHEEKVSGKGPLKKTKLTKLEEIISLVDCYDKRMIYKDINPQGALKELQIDELGNYDLGLINTFKDVLKSEGLLSL